MDDYKITTSLQNSLTFYSPTDKKEILSYLQIVKYLQDAHIVNRHQATIFQLDQDLDYEICLFSQFNSHMASLKSSISNVKLFTNIITCTMTSISLENTPAMIQTCSELLKRLVLEHSVCGV